MRASADRDGAASVPPGGDLLGALDAATRRIEHLETALRSRVVIEQAKGVLRERFGWSLEEAFHVLRYAARSARKPLHDVAERVVASSDTPIEITVALARGNRQRAAHLQEHAEAQQERAARLLAELASLQFRLQARRRPRRD